MAEPWDTMENLDPFLRRRERIAELRTLIRNGAADAPVLKAEIDRLEKEDADARTLAENKNLPL